MSQPAEASNPPAVAWQPLTFGGVASFATAGWVKLLLAGVAAAAVFGASLIWFVHRDYSPVILAAIEKMPESARVENGKLRGVPDTLISETKWLAIAVTPETATEIGQGADVQFQLRQTDFCVNSIFRPDWGMSFDYDPGASLNLGRSALEPWWGAWRPVLLAASGLAAVVFILISWVVLALMYMAPAKFLAWWSDRRLTWRGAWKLCFAAMAPGALVMAFSVFLYGWRAIDLVQLSFFWLAHLVMGWVYAGGGVLASPKLFSSPAGRNPFAG